MRALPVVGCALAACGRLDFAPLVDATRPGFGVVAAIQAGSIVPLVVDPSAHTFTEVGTRIALPASVDSIALDSSRTYLLAAGGDLGSYSFDANGALVHVGSDGGGQYSTTGRMRLAFHPTLPTFYMSGDDAGANNVLEYTLQPDGTLTFRTDVGAEVTPIGIAVNATGTVVYTTSGLAPAQICAHPVLADGTLMPSQSCITACDEPLELFAVPTYAIVVCTSGALDRFVLDGQQLPVALNPLDAGATIRSAAMSHAGIIFVVTDTDELVQIDATSAVITRSAFHAGTTTIALSSDDRYLIGGDASGLVAYDRDAGYAPIATTATDIGGAPIYIAVR